MTLLLVNAGVTCFLAGLAWVVQVVVYPAFTLVGAPEWPAYHAAHSRRIALLVGLPWAVQGASVAGLLLRGQGPLWLLALTAALAAATVALTVWGAVPVHTRLSTYDGEAVQRLLRIHAWRTATWTLGAVTSLALVLQNA